jgi:dTDP-4-amino-4,6-dideoxy-D-galactose acyltransferase
MSASPVCQFLEWDSDFFKVRIGRVLPETIAAPDLARALMWAQEQEIDCLYFLCDAADTACIALVEQAGFRLTDIRITFETKLRVGALQSKKTAAIRTASSADLAALKAIAKASHGDTRFYADPRFPRDKCDLLYETWIKKSCEGWADAVLVLAPHDEPLGYVSCHLLNKTEGQIGLAAIAASARGQGLGSVLVSKALDWFAAQGQQTASVVTQGRNVRAQRLYQQSGFLTRSVQCWFHRWRESPAEAAEITAVHDG